MAQMKTVKDILDFLEDEQNESDLSKAVMQLRGIKDFYKYYKNNSKYSKEITDEWEKSKKMTISELAKKHDECFTKIEDIPDIKWWKFWEWF